jgi:hypothetical protein
LLIAYNRNIVYSERNKNFFIFAPKIKIR